MTISKKDLELLEQALPFMSEEDRRDKLRLLTEYKKQLTKDMGQKVLRFYKTCIPQLYYRRTS
jgi:hypothetical protein